MTESVVYFELDIQYCALTYGVAPCEAVLGPDNPIKCFNSLKTCQDLPHFTRDNIVTLRFTMDSLDRDRSIDAIPCLVSHQFSPGRVSLGDSLGTRTSLNVTFQDILHSDVGPGFDKYWRERPYNPYEQGTLWGKFRARQPYLRGRSCRLIQGFKGQALHEMETRHFIVESLEGPDRSGQFSLSCRDILKMLDGDRAQAPVVSPGYLQSDITAAATTATLSPANIGDEFYPESGLLAIGGKEIVSFTRVGNTLTIVRAQEGTTAQALQAQDRCQLVLKYTAQDAADIVYDLMVNYAGVPPEFITLDAWKEETANYLQTVYTRTIPEPTSVNKLVTDLIRSAALAIWWDDVVQQIQFRVLRAIADTPNLDERVQLEGSLTYRDQPDKRLSEMWTYFGVRNPLRPLTDPDNYLSVERRINSIAASIYLEDAIEKRFAPWIPPLARQTANRLNILILSRFQDPPRSISGAVFRKGLNNPLTLGGGIRLTDKFLQGPTGAPAEYPAQIVSINPREDRLEFTAEEARWFPLDDIDLTDRIVTIDTNLENVNLRNLHDQIYPPIREEDSITFIVAEDIVVSSLNSSLIAMDVGSWPAYIIPKIVIIGHVRGAGGQGGRGASASGHGYGGNSGGPALYTRHPVELTMDPKGTLWGGGGGGGGSAPGQELSGWAPGGGGGGGAGVRGGPGGSRGGSGANSGGTGSATGGASGGWSGGSERVRGGSGGGPGSGGNRGQNNGSRNGGSGGSGGPSINGNSFVTLIGPLTGIRGARIN